MSQTSTRPRTATVIPFPSTSSTAVTTTTTTIATTTTARSSDRPAATRVKGARQRIAQLFRRRQQLPKNSHRPRRVYVEPFERGSVDWQRMLMSVQRLN